jgi:hypothetical protein
LADQAAAWLGLMEQPFQVHDLVDAARRRTGLSDFGDVEFCEPLERFLTACHQEADLSLVGRFATRWDVLRFLSNLLYLRAAESRSGEISDSAIARPIIITGLPRSGTTFLHRLLLQDKTNRAPLVWQTIYPYAVGRLMRHGRDRRAEAVQRQLQTFETLAPEFRALHPLDADSPQECSEITAHVFRSLRFDSNYNVPSYRTWLDHEGHLAAYRFHKRFLQHLQHQSPDEGPRWVLKCPDHIFALDAIRDVYPDARIVFVHRDPLQVLLSVAKLTEILRTPFARHVDPFAIGTQESARYVLATNLMMQAANETRFTEPILHVRHADLIADPLGMVRRLYAHFDLTLDDAAVSRVTAYTRRLPNGGYGAHKYSFADHGLNPDVERRKFASYLAFFGLDGSAGPRAA